MKNLEIVIATRNLHKVREFREMLDPVEGIDILTLMNFPEYSPPEEEGNTFAEIAAVKARDAATKLNKYVLADDSGIVVPALQGAPGIFSRRYAGEDATDAENRKKLLKEMEGFTDLERSAYFECALALVAPDGKEKCVTGICEGMILEEERGSNGFGYDPLFMKHDYDKTFAELSEATKNRISHRHKALQKLIPYLESLVIRELDPTRS